MAEILSLVSQYSIYYSTICIGGCWTPYYKMLSSRTGVWYCVNYWVCIYVETLPPLALLIEKGKPTLSGGELHLADLFSESREPNWLASHPQHRTTAIRQVPRTTLLWANLDSILAQFWYTYICLSVSMFLIIAIYLCSAMLDHNVWQWSGKRGRIIGSLARDVRNPNSFLRLVYRWS